MPTLFIVFGLRFYFWSREHLPIHIHVENADGEAKFVLEPEIRLVENKGMKMKDVRLAESIIEENKEVLIEKWNEYHKK